MASLDPLYVQMLSVGFVVLRQAADSGNNEWIAAELELLHNVPSLIGEPNLERHRYFWQHERTHYLERISGIGLADALSRMRTYYEPIWDEIGAVMGDQLAAHQRSA